ncbi:MAG TPA: membrane protein insertion efficiency factor YidD [Firmicutes bacterium]|nr:membrane protein insertion efficiency factor YidD [Candidatus Fermentithermobacillaceae bacterium]
MVRKGLAYLIRLYQVYISPLHRPSCRYYPTCSEYARQAVLVHGPVRGLLLAFRRILRCNPFSAGGYDPVPPVRKRPIEAEGVN